ncbi:peptidoglycan-binding domain-containing protein [Methanobacterium sp. ACI-7]|uniref:peptidoglycan-binding domain-containing protein n=1 Tax=unclassified Methanobacterium TaxID=2627676 RepID=UPI0039C0407C
MPMSSAAETLNLINTLDEEKLVNAVSNNAIADNTTILSKEQIAKLQKWLQEKNMTNDNGLKMGSTGDQVKKLQSWLKENNFYNGEIDGNFGIDTEIAVKAFQKEVGLKEDGQVGDYTLLAMEQWDEYAAAVTGDTSVSSSSSSEKVEKIYSSVSKSQSNTSKKAIKTKRTSTKKTYSNTRYRGYTNGMDCWAMSAYLSSKLRNQGYNVRTIQYATSMSSRHRSVQYWNGNSWANYDYKGNGYSSIYYATGNSKNGAVIG